MSKIAKMKDITGRKDIDHLILEFYKKITSDPLIGYFFTEVVTLDWDHHIPKIADFWETTLFHKAVYKGNPITPHLDMHRQSPMNKDHFDRWVEVFCQTVDDLFSGAKAEMAKQRALSIATVMLTKIKNS